MNTRELPLLPLRGVLVFPLMVVPLEIGREKSLRALEEAMAADRLIVFVAQKRHPSRRTGGRGFISGGGHRGNKASVEDAHRGL